MFTSLYALWALCCVHAAVGLVVLMAPTGSDSNSGLTLDDPILSLERAQEVIRQYITANGPQDVQVRIGPGKYHGQTVTWDFVMPANTITFMPLFDDKVRPEFIGGTCGTWFVLRHTGGLSNLKFYYLWVEKYGMAISLEGDRNSEAAHNGRNVLYGMYFKTIGNIACNGEGAPAYAAVRLVNSDENNISNNHFVDIINTASCGLLHALYIAHMSDRNVIRGNRIVNNCGDPIRLRDYSNDNTIKENVISRSGVYAAYSDWYCDHETNPRCTKSGPECPSWGNVFHDNKLSYTYSGAELPTFRYFQDDTTAGCSPPSSTAKRLRTWGNTHS